MDGDRFDDLSRHLATGTSRRTALKGAAAALLAAFGLRTSAAAQVTQATCGNQFCINDPCACTPGCVCCVYSNGNSRCRPPGLCAPGTETACVPPTTTPAPTTTTTTTTTTPPSQNTCSTGENVCAVQSDAARCGAENSCSCLQTVGGATYCGNLRNGACFPCNVDADCASQTGPGSVCANGNGCGCTELSNFRACIPPCPTP